MLYFFYNSHPDSHHDKFQAALMNKEPKNLDIVMCYEQSTACVGVKRMSFKVGCRYFGIEGLNINIWNLNEFISWDLTFVWFLRQDSKTTFTKSDIDALLQDNKEKVRIAKPVYSGSPAQSRDELWKQQPSFCPLLNV